MAKKFVRISLAVKFRLFFGLALLAAFGVALGLMWFFVEDLSEQNLLTPANMLVDMRINEWRQLHPENPQKALDANSAIVSLHSLSARTEGLAGPSFMPLVSQAQKDKLNPTVASVLREFEKNPKQQMIVRKSDTDNGMTTVYRCFQAVRNTADCGECHTNNPTMKRYRFRPNQLVGLVEVVLPESISTGYFGWLARGAFVAGGVLAGLLAMGMFSLVSNRIVFKPVHRLRELADKVAEGNLEVRSDVKTGDELQRLGESFNEMLGAIQDQHNKLRSANRALDLKLYELGEANVALYQANQVKNEFLANVSHELRTPLNSIIGFAELLSENSEQKIARYGSNIASAAKNLLTMINDMLDLAKIEAGRMEVRNDKVSVLNTCRTLLGLVKPLSDKNNLQLIDELDDDLPMAYTDGGKLQQILYNLLSNAIKFTPTGGSVTFVGATDEAGENIILRVKDTGPGISETDQTHIFEKFYQASPTLTKEVQGTGLGLSISKELTGLLGGRLTVKSEPGQGAEFSMVLPVGAPSED